MHKLSHSEIAELVIKAQKGQQEAFAMLYTATVERQLYFSTAFLKDSTLAEDVVQEVYLSMFKALPRLKNPKTFVAYLNRICYNTCVDFKNKLYKEKYELDEDSLMHVPDTTLEATPSNFYEFREEQSELNSALDTLSDDHKAAFLMRYYSSMKVKEIATAMNISESTVKRYIKYATKTLSTQLSKSIERR